MIHMKNNFEAMHSVPTPVEHCKGFTIVSYKDISDTKSSRLSKIDASITPEPYILEVITKRANGIHYKSFSFKELSQAENKAHTLWKKANHPTALR